MSLRSMLSEPYEILKQTPAGTDRYNNPQYVFQSAGTVYGRLAQRVSAEESISRDTVVTDWVLILHAGINVDAYDRVRDGAGREFEVIGTPNHATTPRGEHHLELRLRHIAG